MDYVVTKRTDYLQWDEYFMATALLAAKRSKDPATQVGACLVNVENRIIGVGYNGLPKGCSDDAFPWGKEDANPYNNKYMYVCHAESNAILNKSSTNAKGSAIFVTLFPCNDCAKLIIQSGIVKVVYLSDKYRDTAATQAAKVMFQLSGVKYFEMPTLNRSICLDFKGNDLGKEKKIDSETGVKRNNYLNWNDYFLATSFLSAQRSKDPDQQSGACLVNEHNIIVGIGYNGFPQGCSDDILPWISNNSKTETSPLKFKHLFVVHAVVNAILNKNIGSLKNCSLYVNTFPCNECTKIIIQSDIAKVWFLNDDYSDDDMKLKLDGSRRMLKAAGVIFQKYTPNVSKVIIDFKH